MIYDKIENLGKYPELSKVKAFFDENDVASLEIGKYPLGDGDYLAVSEYETGKEKDYEAHVEYIDVQYLTVGEELIYVADKSQGTPTKGYNAEKDIAFYTVENGKAYKIDREYFLLLDVDDLHKPCVAVNEPVKVKKYVFKLKK